MYIYCQICFIVTRVWCSSAHVSNMQPVLLCGKLFPYLVHILIISRFYLSFLIFSSVFDVGMSVKWAPSWVWIFVKWQTITDKKDDWHKNKKNIMKGCDLKCNNEYIWIRRSYLKRKIKISPTKKKKKRTKTNNTKPLSGL